MFEDRNAHQVLGVSPTAGWQVVRQAYWALARRFHPDGTVPDAARMAAINAAYSSSSGRIADGHAARPRG